MKSYIYKEIDKIELKKGVYVDILISDTEIKRGRFVQLISRTKTKDGLYKVKLATGEVGKVINVVSKDELKIENFKFFNKLFFEKELYTLYDKKKNENFISFKNTPNGEKRFALVFSSKEVAEKALEPHREAKKDIIVNKLRMKRKIHENFSRNEVDYFVVNLDKIVQKEKFIQLENEIKSK